MAMTSTSPNMLNTPIPPAIPGVMALLLLLLDELPLLEPDPDEEVDVSAQTPVVFPHAWHHDVVSLMEMLDMLAEKSFHEIVVSPCPNSGNSCGTLVSDADPLANKNRTLTSLGSIVDVLVTPVPLTVALVTSSKVMELA